MIPRDKMVARAVRKVHEEIVHSAYPAMPLIFSEYNASYANEPNVTDSTYMGPWLATTISQCDGLIQSMAYWSFSDVFEEQGVVRTPFYGGFGLMAEDSIPKPVYNVFSMLHRLGDRRLPVDSDSVLATRTAAGDTVVALWNYAPPDGTGAGYTPPPATPAPARTFALRVHGVAGERHRHALSRGRNPRATLSPRLTRWAAPPRPAASRSSRCARPVPRQRRNACV